MTTCPACGKELPGEFPFCPFCGAATEAAPSAVVDRERRVVTVLFCDLVGSTAAAEGTDVEDVQRRLVEYHRVARERIEAFGGVVEKFVGDAVMAVFGAPVAHEDDAERAVRAGLGIVEAVASLDAVRVRVGVNTGEVLVAVAARPESGESYVVGDTVNTAARLQTAAHPDAVVVGESTYRATDRVFEYAELEPVVAKGKADPLTAWHALAAKARFGTDMMRDLRTPMVGRSLELAALQNSLARASDGGMQLVTVVGEPGVGKSRLVAELFAQTDRSDELYVWRQGRCLPYGDGITYWALAEIAKAHLGIYDGDPDEQVQHKLDAFVDAGEDRVWLRAPLGSLVGASDASGVDRESAFAAWRRFLELMADASPAIVVVEDLHWADPSLLDFLEYLADWARESPLLVVGTARPELLTTRPTWAAGLANAVTLRVSPLTPAETTDLIASHLADAPLPSDLQRAVVERSGGNPLYAEEFVRMLRDRGAVDDSGQPTGDIDLGSIALPDTVQALIAARLDTLSPELRAVVQDAAVVGKVFWGGAVAALGERETGDLERSLHELVRKEMVRPLRRSSVEGDHEYSFTHALVRDVAYQRLPRSERLVRHLAAAEWIERLAGDGIGDVAEVLTYHATCAMDLAEAEGDTAAAERIRPLLVRYAMRAGDHLRAIDAVRALALLDLARGHLAADDPLRGEVLRSWAWAATASRSNAEVTEAIEQAVAFYRTVGPVADLAAALNQAAHIAAQGARPHEQADFNAEARALLEPQGDSFALAEALGHSVVHSRGTRPVTEELAMAQRAVAMADRLGGPDAPGSVDAWLSAHNAHATVLQLDSADALTEFEAMAEVADRLRPDRSDRVRNNLAMAMGYRLGPRAAIDALDETSATQRARGREVHAWWLDSTSLEFRLLAGQLQQAAAVAEAAFVALGDRGVSSSIEAAAQQVRAELAMGRQVALPESVSDGLVTTNPEYRSIAGIAALEWLVAAGQAERAGASAEALVGDLDPLELLPRLPAFARVAAAAGRPDLIGALRDQVSDGTPLGRAGRLAASGLALEPEDPTAAATAFEAAAVAFTELGALHEQAHSVAGQGRSRLAAGDRAGARATLAEAARMFDEMEASPAARQCRDVLGAID